MPVRVAVGDPRTVQVEFAAAATGDVEVEVASARLGTTAGPFTATHVGTEGIYSYTPDASLVDELELSFTGIISGTETTLTEVVEVAGRHYFSVAEARSLGPISDDYTDAQIESQRMAVEDQIEANCDTSFVARYAQETKSGAGEGFVRLSDNYVLSLISVTEDDEDVTAEASLDGRYVWRNTSNSPWASGHRNVEVRYESGYSAHPPEDLRRKAIEATRYGLLRESRKGLQPGVVMMGTEVGTLRMAIAGLVQPFGLPEVDAVVVLWAKKVRGVL